MASVDLEELTVDVDSLATRYLVAGEGPPIVLVHGVGESNLDWRWVVPTLSRTRRVYAPNLPAVGGTARPTADYSRAFHAGFLAAFLDALGIDSAGVIGASLHGHSVLRLRSPNRRACRPWAWSAALASGGTSTRPGRASASNHLSRAPP